MSSAPDSSHRRRSAGWLAVGIGLLIVLTAILQGRSTGYGLVLDDYNHRAELREGDWSLRSLVNASHLGDPRRRVRMWWQDEADLYFFRPLAFLLMRATYVAGDWRPEIMHLASLGWGVLCAALVLLLGRRATGSNGWGLLAATIFLMHPNNFLTPRWIACQNEQMATAFTLAALLFYGSYAGWWRQDEPGRDSPPDADTLGQSAGNRRLQPRRWKGIAALILALACYVAALGCRESAVILPILLVIGDSVAAPRAAGASSTAMASENRPALLIRTRLLPYAAFVCIAVVYLALRRQMLGPLTIPARPYAWPMNEPGFLPFIAGKFVYYILGLWAFIPIIGFAGQEQMRAQPAIFYGLFAAILIGWTAILAWLRPSRQIWLWSALAVVPLGPVLPVFASAHHLYLASAGMAVATVLAAQSALEWARMRNTLFRKFARASVVGLICLALLVFTGANYILDSGVAGLAAACQLPIRQVVQLDRPMHAEDKLFFINLPMLAFNCIPAIEEARGVTPLTGYVLTFAPAFLRMDRPAHVEALAPNRLRVWLDDPAYFSGLIGRSILQGIGRERPFSVGQTFQTPEFAVEVARADGGGVQEFIFTFHRPLNDPTYHFFLGSPVFDAYPLAWPFAG